MRPLRRIRRLGGNAQTGFTLNRSGNAISQDNSTITIDQSVGVKVDFATGLSDAMTVMFKYSDLALNAQKTNTLATSFCSGGDENRTGVYVAADGKINGIWNTADWGNASQTLSKSSGVLAFCYHKSNGTSLYYISADGTRAELFNKSGLKASGDTAINGCTIGGERAKSDATLLGAATGMKITGIAIFDGILTEAEMTGYVWPSETQDFNLTVSEDKTWSEVLSAAGVTEANKETANLVITAENNPKITFDIVASVLYGLTVNGSAVFSAGDEVYGSGAQSFGKTLLATSMKTTTEGCLSLPNVEFEVKDGWKGAFITSASDIKLYAQNTETISINIGGGNSNGDSPADNIVSGSAYYGLYPTPGSSWNNINGMWTGHSQTVAISGAKAFDGADTTTRNSISLSGTANNTWQWGGTTVPFLRGYLDDTGSVEVRITGVPYSEYDVIVYATSDSSLRLNYFTINGENYTCGSNGVATTGTDIWGEGLTAEPAFGKNAMLIRGVSGSTLTVSGTRATTENGSHRVTVCAVQIINKGTVESSDWSADLDSTTSFGGGTGSGLSGQSGTWVNNSLSTIIITNKADNATLTLDGEITAASLKIVGAEGKHLTIAKAPDAVLNITVYDCAESTEEVTFAFDPDFSTVNPGANLIGVAYAYSGTPRVGCHYIAASNAFTLSTLNSGNILIEGSGTITGDFDVIGSGTMTFGGTYTVANGGASRLGATLGTVNIAAGADYTFDSIMLANSSSEDHSCTLNVDGTLRVSSTCGSNVYAVRNDHQGILLGHWYGNGSTVNVGATGSILAENAWIQMSYSTKGILNINGGTVKVKGINGGPSVGERQPVLSLTDGGTLEFAVAPINVVGFVRNYGYGTVKNTADLTDPGAITFTDSTDGTTIDPAGNDVVFSGALSGAGKIVIGDSVGGGSVSFTGSSTNLTGDIVVGADTTLNLGTNRPEGEISVDTDGALAVVMASKADVPVLKVSSQPAHVVLYDTDGETVLSGANVIYDAEVGTITVHPPVNTWNVAFDLSFDTAGNWSYGLPESTQDTAIKVTGDAALTIAGTYEAATLTVSGSGVVEFSGAGSFTVGTLYLNGGATLAPNSKIVATSIVLDGGTVLRLRDATESAPISGAGAVETYGAVTFNANNTFTGGLTVKSGSEARTIKTEIGGQAYGKNNYGQAIANLSRIVVEDGGSLDLANTADACYAITISGKGVYDAQSGVYKGALYNSGSEIGQNSRQTASLTLAADAMVKAESSNNGWGIVNSGHAASVLALNGHTLTVSGAGYFPIVNANTASGTQTTGTLIADSVTLGLVGNADKACNLTGVNIVAKGCATINLATAPTALGSLTISPTASGTTASNWNLPTTCVPVVNTANVDVSGLSGGQSVVLFTDTHEHLAYNSNIVWQVGGRFEGHNDAHEVTATYAAGIPQPFLHYDFNNGAAVDTGKASDSKYQISSFDEANSVTLVNSRNGKAVQVHTDYTPYWSSSEAGISSFHAGEATVATVARLKETGIILWGLGNNGGSNTALGLVAPTATSAAVIMRNPDGTVTTLATVSGTDDLTKGWHLFVVVADANGTTFYVDKQKATSAVPAATAIGQQGQLGSFHGGAATGYGYNKAGANGYLLDDWRVYDAALTVDEIKLLKRTICPDPLYIRLR